MNRTGLAFALGLTVLAVVLGNPARAASPPRLTSITLERTGCMGYCPVYSLTLNDKGEATYSGRQFVPRIGVYKAGVDFSTLLAMIAPDDPWSLKDSGPFATDTPSLTLTMVAGNQTRVVRLDRYVCMPPRFASIVAAMDGITAYAGWRPVSASGLAGMYVWSDGVTALDELFIGPNSTGGVHAGLSHAVATSCDALLLPKTSSLGTLRLIEPGIAESTSGEQITKLADGVMLEQGGHEKYFYTVSSGAEFMLRSALEQSVIHNTLHNCLPF